MEILFLGTSAAVPSKDRSTSCIAVKEGRGIVLLDCGEGTQRRLMESPYSFMKIGAILVTHLHGDHVFGLPGLLQTMSLSDRRDPLLICGPPGIRALIDTAMEATGGELSYPIDVRELSGGEAFEACGFGASCFRTDHGMFSIGYVLRGPDRPGKLDHEKALALGARDGPDMARLKRGESVGDITPDMVIGPPVPGISVAYTGDTKPAESTVEAARGVDILIHEATYMDAEAENAGKHNHTTAAQAARLAGEAGVGHLIMTHVSHRYDDRSVLEAEARSIFPESYVADDLMLYEVGKASFRSKYVGPDAEQRIRPIIESLSQQAIPPAMAEEHLRSQCRKPIGEDGRKVLVRMNEHHVPLWEFCLERLPASVDGPILDIGCGGGGFLSRLSARYPDAGFAGVDISEDSLAVTREMNEGLVGSGRLDLQLASVDDLPFGDGSFAMVTAIETYFFWPDLRAGLAEIARVLTPGGILAIGAEERFGAGRDDIVERINREYGARMIPDGEILSLLDSVGMDARAIPGEPGVLYLAVKRP